MTQNNSKPTASSTILDHNKAADHAWRTEDKVRVEKGVEKSIKMFKRFMEPNLPKIGLYDIQNCEGSPYGTVLKAYDENWGIDYLAKRKEKDGTETLIGISFRTSILEGFSLRAESRGWEAEYYKIPRALKDPNLPIKPENYYIFQIETDYDKTEDGLAKPYKLRIARMKVLMDHITANPAVIRNCINKQDGNLYVFIPANKLSETRMEFLVLDFEKQLKM